MHPDRCASFDDATNESEQIEDRTDLPEKTTQRTGNLVKTSGNKPHATLATRTQADQVSDDSQPVESP
jgi:hypothetical protein